ncbi:nickel-responsive transcriptional regulator NikR [Glacieibacterium sp.]|uniref:nickel-responsive transcriptional regulator NikR n=1 Tax=Glacieibacterium sp. TaxID=2860237 RepID=UPI003B009ECA
MQRITVSLDDEVAGLFDQIIRDQNYQSRSEAVRDLVRQAVETRRLEGSAETHCVANLSYIYNHRTRALAQRLLDMQHANHDLVVATTHVILDHSSSFETMILKGSVGKVRGLADAIRAERGVRFGAINLVSVDPNDHHDAPDDHHHHDLGHVSPHPG